MARRICAIVPDPNIREVRLKELKGYLTQQLYPEGLIESGIRKSKLLTLQELRTPKVKDTDETLKKIPFVSTHDPCLPDVFNTIKSNLPILHESETMKKLIPEENLIYSRRQPKNLKKHLTRARIEPKVNDFEIKSCGDSRCGVCGQDTKYLETGKMKSFKDGKKIHVNANMTCKTTNLIYCVTCPGCHENYIGQTGNSLCERVRVHKEQIKHPQYRNSPISAHLDICGKKHFQIMPIFKCRRDEAYRKEMERYFITTFRSKLNPENF